MKHTISNINDIAEGSGCFRAGTLLLTPDGTQRPIEDFKKHDKIICYDETYLKQEGIVLQCFKHSVGQRNLIVTLSNGTVLHVTANHWMLDRHDAYKEVSDFKVGDSMLTAEYTPAKIVSIEEDETVDSVYNLKVHPHPTFITDGILAHNGGGGKGGASYSATEAADSLFSIATAQVLDLISEGEIEGFVDKYENTVTEDNIGKAIYLNKTPIKSDINANFRQNFDNADANVTGYNFTGVPVRTWAADDYAMLYANVGQGTRMPFDAINPLVRNADLINDGVYPSDLSVNVGAYSSSYQLPVKIVTYSKSADNRAAWTMEFVNNGGNVWPGAGWNQHTFGATAWSTVLSTSPTGAGVRIADTSRSTVFAIAESADNRGLIWTGLFIAPVTGTYTFEVSADKQGMFSLYTDDTETSILETATTPSFGDSASKWHLALGGMWYNSAFTAPVSLTAGNAYFVKTRFWHYRFANHIGVRFKCTDSSTQISYDFEDGIPPVLMSPNPVLTPSEDRKKVPLNLYSKGTLSSTNEVDNFSDVKIAYVTGTSVDQQPAIVGFSQPSNTVPVGVQIKRYTPYTITVNDGFAESVTVAFRINALMISDSDSGSVKPTSVSFVSRVNNTDPDRWTITGKCSSPYQFTRKFYPPIYGQSWTIKIERLTEDPEELKVNNDTFIEFYAVNNNEMYSYPNTALVAIETRADHFSSVPNRMYHVKGLKIKIPSGYDPVRRTYGAVWDGTFKTVKAWSDNPVWQFYDMCTNKRYALGNYIEADMVNKWELYNCAKYCDEMIATGKTEWVRVNSFSEGDTYLVTNNPLKVGIAAGTVLSFVNQGSSVTLTVARDTFKSESIINVEPHAGVELTNLDLVMTYAGAEPRFQCSFYYQTFVEAWKALRDLASAFRAAIFWMDGGVSLSQDRPVETKHQMFTNDNVLGGEFSYTGGDVNDRHTMVRVQWNDPDKYDAPVVETVEDIQGILRYGQRIKSMTAFGARSKSQALRVAKWYLFTSLHEAEIVAFSAGQEGAYTHPGRVIMVRDNDRDAVKGGGRVKEITNDGSTDTIVFDKSVELKNGHDYKLVLVVPTDYNTPDEVTDETSSDTVYAPQVVEYPVDSDNSGELLQITLEPGTTVDLPTGVDGSQIVWAIKDETVNDYTSWKVISVAPEKSGAFVITAKRYYDEKFTETDAGIFSYTPEVPDAPSAEPSVPSDFVVSRKQKYLGGGSLAYYEMSWTPPANTGVAGYTIAYTDSDIGGEPIVLSELHRTTRFEADLSVNIDALYVRTVTVLGKQSEWAKQENIIELTTDIFELRPVTGLELANDNGTTDGVFNDTFATFRWRLNNALVPEIGDGVGADEGNNVPWFSHYVIDVSTIPTFAPDPVVPETHLGTYKSTEQTWTYTFDQMRADFYRKGLSLKPSFKVRVSVVDAEGKASLKTLTEAYNSVPSAVTSFTAVRDLTGILLDWEPPAAENDIINYQVLQSLTADINDAVHLAYTQSSQYAILEDNATGTYDAGVQKYYFIKSIDWFGQVATSSPSASVTPVTNITSFAITTRLASGGGLQFSIVATTPAALNANEYLQAEVFAASSPANIRTFNGVLASNSMTINFLPSDAGVSLTVRLRVVLVSGALSVLGVAASANQTATVNADEKPPAAVTGVGISYNSTTHEVTVTWTNPSDVDFKHVLVEWADSAQSTTWITSGRPTASPHIIENILPRATDYNVTARISSVDELGNEQTPEETSAVLISKQVTPDIDSFTAYSTESGIELVWTDALGITFDKFAGYRLTIEAWYSGPLFEATSPYTTRHIELPSQIKGYRLAGDTLQNLDENARFKFTIQPRDLDGTLVAGDSVTIPDPDTNKLGIGALLPEVPYGIPYSPINVPESWMDSSLVDISSLMFTADNATNEFTLVITPSTWPIFAGCPVKLQNTSGALPTGLSADQYYYFVITGFPTTDVTKFALSTSINSEDIVSISDNGSGLHYVTAYPPYVPMYYQRCTFSGADITLWTFDGTGGHKFSTGEWVMPGTTDTLPTGVSANTEYYVRRTGYRTFSIYTSELSTTPISLSGGLGNLYFHRSRAPIIMSHSDDVPYLGSYRLLYTDLNNDLKSEPLTDPEYFRNSTGFRQVPNYTDMDQTTAVQISLEIVNTRGIRNVVPVYPNFYTVAGGAPF